MIKHGLVAETGSHDELISKGGVYKKLVLRQLSSMQDRAAIINSGLDDYVQESDDSDESDSEQNLDEKQKTP